jgi:hypothetical protein
MLSKEAKKYLKEVWGFDNIKDIDNQTIACLKENITLENFFGEYSLDREILVALEN